MAKTQSFIDRDGNRFIIPSYIIYEDDENAPSGYDVITQSMTFALAMGSEVELEKDWFVFDEYKFPHISIELRSNKFLHGACTAYAFEGPLFDKIAKENTNETASD